MRGHRDHILQRSQAETQHIPLHIHGVCAPACASETLSGHKWRRALSFDSCTRRGGAPVSSLTCPQKGPRCNSNISAIRFEGLNCQERMMAATGRPGCKRQARLLSEVGSAAPWRGGPRYHAALATVCRIREKLNANGDGI